MTLDQAVTVLDQAGPGSQHRLAAYVVVFLLAGIRTEEARALTRAEVDLGAGTVAVYRLVRAKGDTKTRKSPRELRHSFVSILSAHGVRIEDISDLMGHSGTTVTETVYRHELRPALTTGATAMDKILTQRRTPPLLPRGEPATPRLPAPSPQKHSPPPIGQRPPSREPEGAHSLSCPRRDEAGRRPPASLRSSWTL